MEKVQIFNTLSRKKEEFKSLNPSEVTFYQCGPTVYWTQHIGNMRAMVLADFIFRSLQYIGYDVKLARNYTDVGHLTSDGDTGQDKMSKTAQMQKVTPSEIAKKFTKIFDQDVLALNTLQPSFRPKATDHVKQMIKMVEIMLEKGYAYTTDLAVYFDTSKFKNYTQLSGQNLEENISDAGKGDVSDKNKKHSSDFAVWFFAAGVHKNALQTWPSPFKSSLVEGGKGFPGWHIECSAMSQKYLGETIDIHMGGVEHIPVHHTNEIAQSESVTGKKFVNYWLHNEHLTVDGGKMSKSEGTAYSVSDIVNKGYDPLALRYLFLQSHYRSKQNFTWQALESAQVSLNNLRDRVLSLKNSKPGQVDSKAKQKFVDGLVDDFNIPQALATIWDTLKSKIDDGNKLATILDFDKVLGLNLDKLKAKKIPDKITKLAKDRLKAKNQKDFKKSDELRDKIIQMGYLIEDTVEGFNIKKK